MPPRFPASDELRSSQTGLRRYVFDGLRRDYRFKYLTDDQLGDVLEAAHELVSFSLKPIYER